MGLVSSKTDLEVISTAASTPGTDSVSTLEDRSTETCATGSGLGFNLMTSSTSFSVSYGLSQIQGELLRQTRSLQQVSSLTYDAFLASILELNEISGHFLDSNGKQMVFAVKKGTDSTVLWKATVRVACVKLDAVSKEIDSYRCLNLKQYLRVYNSLRSQTAAVREFEDKKEKEALEGAAANTKDKFELNSKLLDQLANDFDPNSLEECCICLERKPDVILPCTHSYCLPCIEQWNVDHKTCPVCRETLKSTDDSWVISEGPDSLDVATEIQKSLMDLAQ